MKNYLLGILSFAVGIVVLFILLNVQGQRMVNLQSSSELVEAIQGNRRVLVIAPHSDDEVLGAGGVIYQALKRGDQVKVILMTNGDGFAAAADVNLPFVWNRTKKYIRLGEIRQQETVQGMRELGLSEKNIIFLGYPDGGLDKLWSQNWDKPYFNPHDLSYYSPYSLIYHTKTAYTGENVVRDLTKIIKDYQPTDIYYPNPNDVHPDHWSTNCFVKYILTKQGLDGINQNLYLVHLGFWPMNLPLGEKVSLIPPPSLLKEGNQWLKIPLDPEERNKKKQALLSYHTQMRVMEPFLLSFIRSNELFSLYPNVDLPKDSAKLLVLDPERDFLGYQNFIGADIAGIYGYAQGENLILELKVKNRPNKKINYWFHLRLIGANGETQKNDLQASEKNFSGDRIVVKVPLGSAQYLFLSAETKKGNRLLDKTPWRIVNL